MGLESTKTCNDLQQELDEAKVTLISLNDNIRRIVGRNHNIRTEKHKIYDAKRTDNDRQSNRSNDGPKPKRRAYDARSVFQRLSGPIKRESNDEEEERPRLTSRVFREMPTRQEIVAVQCADSESRERNRRMFGCLLGTLHKFTQEETKLKKKEEKKAQIERKLEEQEMQERESLKKERENLFLDRKRKQLEIKKLEIKVNRLKDFEAWEASMSYLKNFIKTKTKQPIYYKPKILNKKTEKLLNENVGAIDAVIEKRRHALKKEMLEIENNLKLNDIDLEGGNDIEPPSIKFDGQLLQGKNTSEKQDAKAEVHDSNKESESESPNSKIICEPVISSNIVVINPSKQSPVNE